MQVSKDALWKGIIESLIDDFLAYFFPDLVRIVDFERGIEFLDTELQKIIPDISLIIDFIRYFVPFTNSEINANFEQDLLTLSNTVITMGLREAILEDVKQQGIEQVKLEVTLNLWSTHEFSLEKIAMLVDLPIERVQELIMIHLQSEGMTEETALATIQTYQEKFNN